MAIYASVVVPSGRLSRRLADFLRGEPAKCSYQVSTSLRAILLPRALFSSSVDPTAVNACVIEPYPSVYVVSLAPSAFGDRDPKTRDSPGDKCYQMIIDESCIAILTRLVGLNHVLIYL